MKKNGALDIIFKIFSILLCIVLVPALIMTTIVGSISNMITPATLTKVVKNIDVAEMITQDDELVEELEQAGITTEVIEQVFESETVSQIIEVYAEDISAVLNGEASSFDSETIKNIIGENRDEITQIITTIAGDDMPEDITQEEIDKHIDEIIDVQLVPMFEELPKPEAIIQEMEIPTELIEAIKVFNSGLVTKVCIAFCAILLVLVLLLRLRECSFLIWFSVISIITAVLLTSIYSGISMLPTMLPAELPIPAETVGSIIAVLTQTILITLIVMFVLAAVFMTLFFVLRKIRNNKKQNELQEEAPVEA